MDEVIEVTKKLKKSLLELPEIKEYLKLKDLYEKDESLKQMRRDIARLKNEGKEEERNNLLNIYNNHPLVNNYNLAKEEVKEILQTIRDIIQ